MLINLFYCLIAFTVIGLFFFYLIEDMIGYLRRKIDESEIHRRKREYGSEERETLSDMDEKR